MAAAPQAAGGLSHAPTKQYTQAIRQTAEDIQKERKMKKYKRKCSLKRSGRRIYGEAIYSFNLPDRTARKH